MEINRKLGGGTRLEWIASLRGIAALLVFISHLPLKMTYETRFVIGRIGVTAFFFISGFLAVSSRKRMSGRRYLFNRFVRIYPVYWLLLLLMCLVMDKEGLSLLRIVANITCFQEFLGQENILGASWMLPIQIIFFALVAIVGIDRFAGKKRIQAVLLFGILAVGFGVLRYITGKPFPTAFFLLINVALIGIAHREQLDVGLSQGEFGRLITAFEVTLILAVVLSYRNMIPHYIGAYNVGLLLVWLSENREINWEPFEKLGTIGFTFFLGADIPYVLLKRFVDLSTTLELRIIGCVIKFGMAVVFAILITRFVENPLQKQLRKVEETL